MEQGVLAADAPTVLAGDPWSSLVASQVIADGNRRRERDFGRVTRNQGPTLTPTTPWAQSRRAHMIQAIPGLQHQTVTRYAGISDVVASSSAASPGGLGPTQLQEAPFAAVDSDPGTVWRSAPFAPALGQWIELRFPRPTALTTLNVAFDDNPLVAVLSSRVSRSRQTPGLRRWRCGPTGSRKPCMHRLG